MVPGADLGPEIEPMTLNWLRDAEEAAERQDAEIAQRREDESDMPEFMKNWN